MGRMELTVSLTKHGMREFGYKYDFRLNVCSGPINEKDGNFYLRDSNGREHRIQNGDHLVLGIESETTDHYIVFNYIARL